MKNYPGSITYLSLHLTPLLQLSSTSSLDTILADVSREVKEQIFHVHFYCFQNKLSFSFNLSSFCSITIHRVITLITLVKINTSVKMRERRLDFFFCLFFMLFLNSSLFTL